MKATPFIILSLYFLSVHAVINQEAQRREAPASEYGAPPPPPPSNQYGPPVDQRQRRIQAMQRLIAAMRSGYSGQSRVVNQPRPIPIHKPQNSYGPPARPQPPPPQPQNTYGPPSAAGGHSSSSLHAFAHNHNPDVRCDGWIPIPGPSGGAHATASGSASSSGSIDTSYGPPNHHSSHGHSGGGIDASYHAHGHSGGGIDTSYGPPSHGHGHSGGAIDTSYGPPNHHSSHGHSSSSSSGSSGTLIVVPEEYGPPPPPPVAPQQSYGPPATFSGGHASSVGSIDTSYGVPPPPSNPQPSYRPPQVTGSGHSSSASIAAIDTSYGAPSPAPIIPHKEYGPPATVSGGHATSVGSIDTSYGVPPPPVNPQPSYGPPHSSGSGHSSIDTSFGIPPAPLAPQKEYGPPATVSNGGHASSVQTPHNEYGPPIIVGTGHASSATAVASIDSSYSAPPPPAPLAPIIEDTYGPPSVSIATAHGSSSVGNSIDTSYSAPSPIGHQVYGVPKNPADFGPPESSYGPPPSGAVHHHHHHHQQQQQEHHEHHSSGGHAGEFQQVQSIGTELQLPEINSGAQFDNAIGFVSSTLGVSGNSEVVQSHAIHESHTSEVANGNSFTSSGSSDTYSAPPLDSYAPGKYQPSFINRRPPQQPPINHRPPPPPQQRPPPRPQYIPPVPQKLVRPQGPPPSFRPLPQNGHAQSIAHSYSAQSHTASHSQTVRHPPPRQPLIHRPPVPQGLIQSIGQSVQAQDNGYRGQHLSSNTYLPPPSNELPIPPMKLVVPHAGPVQPFHSQSGGVATSSSAFSLHNSELRNVHVIHDCGKGPQLSQSYGTPLAPPLTQYGPPSGGDSHSAVLSTSYEVPAQSLEVPQHNNIDFNSPASSYGPPASGPANLDVIGLESRNNAVVVEPQASESKEVAALPGLSGSLGGLDFISATKSHTLVLPTNQATPTRNFQLQIQGSHTDARASENSVDGGPDHQTILADGLLQSILNAIEQPAPTVPQVTEDAERGHDEAKKFLESEKGQQVLAEQTKNEQQKQ